MDMPKSKILRVFLILILILVCWISWSFNTAPEQRAPRDFPAPTSKFDFGKALIVYYSSGGNTAEVARRIRDMTDGTLFEIETDNAYPSTPALYIIAGLELKSGSFPILKKRIDDFSAYDTIFVGSPVWWYTISTPVLSFLSRTDFKGKTVVPFATDGGNFGNYFADFEKEARNANLAKGISFTNVQKTDISILDKEISTWLNECKSR
jgi:flavodoxin